jgi:hypothetical protein
LSSADLQDSARDARLVTAIGLGDQQAMGRLYNLYSSLVYSVALRVLGDTGAAEDILQEVFIQLWRNPTAFDSGRGFQRQNRRCWAYGLSPCIKEEPPGKFNGIGLTVGFCPVQGRIRHFWRWHRGVFSRSAAGRLKSPSLLIRETGYTTRRDFTTVLKY